MEEDKLEKIVNALLKASERIEKTLNEELGTRLEDLDLTITFIEKENRKDVVMELGLSGLRTKKPYEEIVEDALREGEEELDRALGKNAHALKKDKE